MKYCDKCHVEVRTNQPYCPLCHQVLKGESELARMEVYPEYVPPIRTVRTLTKKAVLFVTVVSIITLLIVNLTDFDGRLWSLIPIGAILYVFVIIRLGILSRHNIAFKLAILTTILIAILNVIDQEYTAEAYRGWALDYVTPLSLLACNIAISVIILIKRINYRDYLFYLLTIVVFSLVPPVLCLFDVIRIDWPSLAAFGLAGGILLGIIFFFPKSIKAEIKKRFHL